VNNPVPEALPQGSAPCTRDYEGGFATALMLKVSSPTEHACT
jgi:3-hydroxyisobutyrate dehydrogenase